MKTWKKNMIAAAVLVTVCAGIYLNWLYADTETAVDLTDTLDSGKILSEDMLVMSTDAALEAAGEDLAQNTVTDYFAAVRLSRQEEAMAYGEDQEVETSSGQLDTLVQTALSEAQIESLVIAKGYTDCVAYMSDEGISVAVASPEGGLQQEDVAVIADIVMSQSNYELESIRIVEVQ